MYILSQIIEIGVESGGRRLQEGASTPEKLSWGTSPPPQFYAYVRPFESFPPFKTLSKPLRWEFKEENITRK